MIKGFLGAVFAVLFTVTVWADAGNTQGTDYPTDYYMIVESKEGGINIYAEPDLDSQKLNEQLIPNGTALHIEGILRHARNDRLNQIQFFVQDILQFASVLTGYVILGLHTHLLSVYCCTCCDVIDKGFNL